MTKENIVRELLKRKYPNEIVYYNYRPDWLINPKTGHSLELDIYYPNLKLAVEIQGLHHELDYQKFKDNIKDEICFKKGITLYKLKLKNKILKKFIKKLELDGQGLNLRFGQGTPKKGTWSWDYYRGVTKLLEKERWNKVFNIQNEEVRANRERMRVKGLATLPARC